MSEATPARILVVDDDPTIRRFVQKTLTSLGYQVEMAAGGQEALAKAQHPRFYLLLLDVMMPDMDGFEVLKALRLQPEYQETPIIFFAAKRAWVDDPYHTKERQRAREVGGEGVLFMPCSDQELITTVQWALGQKRPA